MSSLTSTQLQQQYIAYFGRPGDPAGIDYWLSSTSGVTTEREFADKIYAQDEYKTSTVGTKSTEEQVNNLYKNLFGRTADATGLLYWTGQIEQGILSLSNLAVNLIHSAQNPLTANATQGATDAAVFAKKVAAAEAFTADVRSDVNAILSYQPEATSPWTTGAAFTSAKDYITGITTTAHTAAGIDTAVAAMITAKPAVAAQSVTLKTTLDNITTGEGDDTISGAKGTIDSDTIDGKGGTDTLSLTLTNADDNNAVFTSTNVENLKFRVSSGAVTLDLGDVTGATSITAERTAGNLTLNDVQAISPLTIDRNTGNANITVDWNATVDAGTSDSITINVKNSSDVGTVLVDGIETVNLVSTDSPSDDTNELRIDSAGTGSATEVLNISGAGDTTVVATDSLTIANSASGDVTLTPTAATAVTHTGSGKLTVSGGVADISVTASSTGALVYTDGNAGDTTVTGSSGDDRFDFAALLTTGDTIVGGTGTDTLVIDGDSVSSSADGDITVSGVETLEIDTDSADTLDFDVFANPSQITSVVIDSIADADTVTLTDTQASTFTINNGNATTNEDIAAVTVDLKTATGSSDAITINLNQKQDGTTNSDTFQITTGITANSIETITLNTSFTSALGTAEDITVAALTSNAISTLNISGTADLQVTAALDTGIDTITSTSTGATTLTVSGSDVAYTGGSGIDTLSFGSSLTAADSFDGGDGVDVVNATFASGTITPTNFSNVETFNATFTGGALNASGLSGLSTITIVDASAGAVVSGLANTTTTIQQEGGGNAALNLQYASGAAATVAYVNTDATEAVTNSATTTNNIKTLTVTADDGTTTDRTVSLGSLNGGSVLDAVTLKTGDDTGDTLDAGNITGSNLQTITITADEANVTMGTLVSAGELKTLTIGNLDSASDGDIIVGAIGNTSAADEITSFTLATSGDANGGTTVVDMATIDAAGATFTTFSVDLNGNYGSSDIGIITAEAMGDISITTDANGTTFDIDQFLVADKTTSSVGNVTINAGAAFDGLDGFITTGATGTVGDISITSPGAVTIADGANETLVDAALTVGNITFNASNAAASFTIGEIEEATTIGNITFTGTGSIDFDGAPAATTVGNVTGSVGVGETVNLTGDTNTIGTTAGVMGTTTVTGAGTFNMDVGAVTTLGNIDLSGMTSVSASTMALSNTTAVGVIFTGGSGTDNFTATGGGDTITPGLGSDTVRGNDGADTIALTESTDSADTVILDDDDSVDTITGFTTNDIIAFDISELGAERGTGNSLNDSTDDVASTNAADILTIANDAITAASDVASTDNIIFVSNTTGLNSSADVDFNITFDAKTTDAADAFITVFYDADDTNAIIGYVTDTNSSGDANVTVAGATTTFVQLAAIDMTAATYASLATGNFSFVA